MRFIWRKIRKPFNWTIILSPLVMIKKNTHINNSLSKNLYICYVINQILKKLYLFTHWVKIPDICYTTSIRTNNSLCKMSVLSHAHDSWFPLISLVFKMFYVSSDWLPYFEFAMGFIIFVLLYKYHSILATVYWMYSWDFHYRLITE